MTVSATFDAAGRRRSPATMPGYHAGRPPRNKGQLYPADPPTVEEIIAVMRQTADDRHGARLRALIVVLWRGGLRIQEALALGERDLDDRRGSLVVRQGKGGRRREVGMDAWGWKQLRPWLAARAELPVGPLFCVIDGPIRGRAWSSAAARLELHRLARQVAIRRRFAPHQLRHTHAVLAREGLALNIIQRQLGHANLGTTSIRCLRGVSSLRCEPALRRARPDQIPPTPRGRRRPARLPARRRDTDGRWRRASGRTLMRRLSRLPRCGVGRTREQRGQRRSPSVTTDAAGRSRNGAALRPRSRHVESARSPCGAPSTTNRPQSAPRRSRRPESRRSPSRSAPALDGRAERPQAFAGCAESACKPRGRCRDWRVVRRADALALCLAKSAPPSEPDRC